MTLTRFRGHIVANRYRYSLKPALSGDFWSTRFCFLIHCIFGWGCRVVALYD